MKDLERPAEVPESTWGRMMAGIAEDQRRSGYAVRPVATGEAEGSHALAKADAVEYESRSQEQRLVAEYSISGPRFRLDDSPVAVAGPGAAAATEADWVLGLNLVSMGRAAAMSPVGKAELEVVGARLSYKRPAVEEWYETDRRGIEQGFTIVDRPLGSGALRLEMELRGGFVAKVDADGLGSSFVDGQGATQLRYTGLKAWDVAGKVLSAMLEWDAETGRLAIKVDDAASSYPLHIDPRIASRNVETKVLASDGEADAHVGFSVSISGDTLVVGGGEATYVYERNEGGAMNWGEVTKLTASDGGGDDQFGVSVSISRDTLVVGASFEDEKGNDAGAAYVYERNEGGADNWGEVTKLTASDGEARDYFNEVSVSGDTLVVGASGEDEKGDAAGAAYVYERDEGGTGNWGEVTKLTASDGGIRGFLDTGHFGNSVSISEDTLVVGANYESEKGSRAGAAYVFERNEGGADNWGEVTKLTATDGEAVDFFGESVSISRNTLVVGARVEDEKGDAAGAAYVYERNEGGTENWGEVTKLTALDGEAGDEFGRFVSISRDTVVVGASLEGEKGDAAGAAYVYTRNAGGTENWGEVTKLTASDGEARDHFGNSVSISGATLVVGAPGEDEKGMEAGAAYVYRVEGADMEHIGQVYLPNLGF